MKRDLIYLPLIVSAIWAAHATAKAMPVSYTHLDVYKRQPMTMPLAVEWTNLHQILRSLYADMLPLCSDMMGIAKGLAGLGALFFTIFRISDSIFFLNTIKSTTMTTTRI